MSLEFVNVYDLDTKKITRIPKCELAPGMIKANIQGMEGEYWVNAAKVKTSQSFQHPPFEGDAKEFIEEIHRHLKEVNPMNYKEWEDGFRLDRDPKPEIALWLTLARKYHDITEAKFYTLAQKKDVFTILGSVLSGGEDAKAICDKVPTLNKDEAAKILNEFISARFKMNEDKKYEYILNMGKLMRYHDEPNKDIRDGSSKDIEVYNIGTGKWGIEEGLNMSWLYDAIRITKETAEFFIANPDILRADKSEGGYPDPYDD